MPQAAVLVIGFPSGRCGTHPNIPRNLKETPSMVEPDWTQANCAGWDVELFFPLPGPTSDEKVARQICHQCVIKEDCLDWVLAKPVGERELGIWGGTTEADRNRLLAGRLRERCPICQSGGPQLVGRDQICTACGISWPAIRGGRVQPNGDRADAAFRSSVNA